MITQGSRDHPVKLNDHLFGPIIKEINWGGKIGVIEMVTTNTDGYRVQAQDLNGDWFGADFVGEYGDLSDIIAVRGDPIGDQVSYTNEPLLGRNVRKNISQFEIPNTGSYIVDGYVRWIFGEDDFFNETIARGSVLFGYPMTEMLTGEFYKDVWHGSLVLGKVIPSGVHLAALVKEPDRNARTAFWWKPFKPRNGQMVFYTSMINFARLKGGRIYNLVHREDIPSVVNTYTIKIFGGSGRYKMGPEGDASITPMDNQKLLKTVTGTTISAPAGEIVKFDSNGFI